MLSDVLQWQADRATLRKLHFEQPTWSKKELALRLNRSLSWVKKWLKRFRLAANPLDPRLTWGLPSVRKTPLPPPHPLIIERILDIRDHPPHNLNRVPGPRTIAYYLKLDQVLLASGLKPPTSTSFIWRILCRNGRISPPQELKHQAMELPPPMAEWEADYKDVSSVKVGVEGKRAHLVEVLDALDVGTSILAT
ncbi:MAG TPA: hypothetical protein VH186_31895 [Chloroflexia bacterium]|nr:hypothetical protein [Chloroflexia bacterium]